MRQKSCRKFLPIRLMALLLWAICLLWLSLSPDPPGHSLPLLSWDKLQHAAAYALLTLLAGRFLSQWRPQLRRPWLYAWIGAVAFGGCIEILQGVLTFARKAEWGDLAADAVGGMAVVAATTARGYLHRRKSAQP